jgi:hypothetical protein
MIGLVWLKDRMHRAAASHFVEVATTFCATLGLDGEGAALSPGALAIP